MTNKPKRLSRTRRIVAGVAGVFCALILLFVVTVFVIVACSRRDFVSPDTTGWKTGDIFFSAGNSWRSLVVRYFGGESDFRSTHCGFVLMVDGKPRLVHMSTEKNAITIEDIDEYARVNDVASISVRRLSVPADTVCLKNEINRLIRVGKAFDNDFNHRDTTAYYCTEFIIRTLERQGNRSLTPLLDKVYVYPVDIEANNYTVPITTAK